jgi:hypothetical protein
MSNKEKHDWSTFTDKSTSIDLFGKSFRKGMSYDSYSGKTKFTARALSDMFPLSANQAMAIDGGSTGGDTSNERYAFKARIIGENSPHSFLPDPCEPAYVSDSDVTYKIIAMHTTFISTNLLEGQAVTRGDIVIVELEMSNQTYELEYGRFVGRSSAESPVDTAGTECFSLVSLEGNWAPNFGNDNTYGPAGGEAGSGKYYECKGDNAKCGPKDDPTFTKCKTPTYASLSKKTTTFKKYTETAVIAAVKASGQPEHIQKIMFAFLAKEQPKLSFPNNNVAGIQLDGSSGFTGASETDFDYQSCFRDGGGDQRIFAGFDTLQKGMIVFGKVVAGKMSVFKKPPGNSVDADAETLTWNYYRSWNLALSPDKLEELKRDGQIEKNGKIYKKNWDGVKKSFKTSLTKWQSA